jgi:broad specificity phosphatase PhoE
MTRIYVARHGQSTWNAERRWAGHADPPLTELGRAQALQASEMLRSHGFNAVGSSNLVRARETAAILAAGLGLPLLEPTSRLDERMAGEISGLTSTQIEERLPGFLDCWRSGEPVEIPGGEPWQAFVDRVLEGLAQLEAKTGRVLVVSHMGVLRAINHSFGRPQRRYDNLEGTWIAQSEEEARPEATS